ncbi:hypothetical protein [Undibacterium sp. TS12]|uniref:hypothetical protein n=1 Tax=Undibacterium sp. TS12 TaxID=2908202 RepID=UPI001F4C86BC|nr:hypothetical protein [Undibacterium sp. TS12]MCH8622943.1 hypothetical protein [Undibacterium sp. TS12]
MPRKSLYFLTRTAIVLHVRLDVNSSSRPAIEAVTSKPAPQAPTSGRRLLLVSFVSSEALERSGRKQGALRRALWWFGEVGNDVYRRKTGYSPWGMFRLQVHTDLCLSPGD